MQSSMEDARLKANELFRGGNLHAAAEAYASALDYVFRLTTPSSESSSNDQPIRQRLATGGVIPSTSSVVLSQPVLDEFTKSAGNLATCLHKLRRFPECKTVCRRALAVNPFLAKCHAFVGMVLVDQEGDAASEDKHDVSVVRMEDAHMHLCRALFLLPAMTPQLSPYIASLVEKLGEAYHTGHERATGESDVSCPTEIAEVRDSDGCGHGVFVSQGTTIAPGTVIVSLTNPFSVAAYSETDGYGVCVSCSLPNTKSGGVDNNDGGVRCAICKRVWYCSQACRAAYALRHAEYECNAFVKLGEMMGHIEARQIDVPDDFEDIASHCIVTRSAIRCQNPGWERVWDLDHHSVEVSQTLSPIGALMQDLFPQDEPAQLVQLVGAVRCNALEVCDGTGLGVGQALHAVGLASFFNHSCVPNCAIDHHTQAITCARTVRHGEELTISYIPNLYWPLSLRREGLADRFFFTCRCLRCTNAEQGADVMEKVLRGTLPGARPNATEYYHTVIEMLCGGVRSRHVADIDKGVLTELLQTRSEAERHLMPCHYVLQDLRNTLSFVYSVLGMAREARRSCTEELLLWESLVPGRLPVKMDKLRNVELCEEKIQQEEDDGVPAADGCSKAPLGKLDEAVEAINRLLPRYRQMYR